MKRYTSEEIIAMDDLYDLQDTFASSGIAFEYQMTPDELYWAEFIKDKYIIADWVFNNLNSDGVLSFNDPCGLTEALESDGIHHKAVMLSDETALQKLFFWLS